MDCIQRQNRQNDFTLAERMVRMAKLTGALFLALALSAAIPAQSAHPPLAQATAQVAASPVTAAYLQGLLNANNFIEFAHRLPEAQGLRPEQEQYFQGTLAYRQGRFDRVIDPLVNAVRTKRSALTQSQQEDAFEILAQTEAKTYQYGFSARMYQDIEELYGPKMGAPDMREVEEKQHLASLLAQVPAETVRLFGDFSLQRGHGDQAGEYPIRINGRELWAQLDTGASVSLISETVARQWKVGMLNGEATLHGYGGASFSARPAVIDELQIGSAELHHVVVFVTNDANLNIPGARRQMNAVLGFPVAYALGRLTFARDGRLTVSANLRAPTTAGAPMWVGDGSLLIALGTEPVFDGEALKGGTRERLFEIDTGSGSTYLTDRFLKENQSTFPGEPPQVARLAGAGGVHEIPAFEAHKLPLFFGSTPVLLSGQHVLTQPQGGEAESYYGVIGQDVLRLFSSYTLDFRAMKMTVTP